MKILITGANGSLAYALKSRLSAYEVTALDRGAFDITNRDQVLETIMKLKPDFVLNAAGYTAVDDAEDNYDETFRVNAEAVQYLAEACSTNNAFLIHFSTDYVFDGKKEQGYSEDDAKHPLSAYGKSKAVGEDLIKDHCDKYAIIRSSWLFGPHGKNFVDTMLKLADEKAEINVVNDQKGCPTYTMDLADAVAAFIQNPQAGIFHISNSSILTWFDFAKLIFKMARKSTVVKPISSLELGRKAQRPQNSVLINNKLPHLRTIDKALAEYLNWNN